MFDPRGEVEVPVVNTGVEQNIQAKLEAEKSRTKTTGKRDRVKLSHLTEKFGEYKAEKKYHKKEIWKEDNADEEAEGDIVLLKLSFTRTEN